MKRSVLTLMAWLIAGSVHAATLLATPGTYATAYAKAAPYDTLVLAPGAYGDIIVRKPHLTIQGVPGVVLGTLSIISPATDVAVDGVEVGQVPTATTKTFSGAVRVIDVDHVTLTNVKAHGGLAIAGLAQGVATAGGTPVIGLPVGRAFDIQRSPYVTITACEVSTFFEGITFSDADHLTISGCNVHDVRTSMIHGSLLGFLTLNANWLHDSRPYALGGDGDHADFIHPWTDPVRGQGRVPGLVITNNVLDQGAGQPIMGIYLDDNANNLGFTGATIAGNVIITGNPQGMRLENTWLSSITGNWLLGATPLDRNVSKPPSIYLRADNGPLVIAGNVLGDTYKPKTGYSGQNIFTPPGLPSDLALTLARARYGALR